MNAESRKAIKIYFDRMRDLLGELGLKNPDLDSFLLSMVFDGFTADYTVAPDLFPIDAVKDP